MKKRYNEYDDNYAQAYHQKVKAKRRKIWKKRLTQFLVFVLLIVFFVSPFSRVNKIKVVGLSTVDEATFLSYAKLSKKDLFILKIPYFLEQSMKKIPGIESAKVTNLGFFGMTVHVVESPVVAQGSNSKGVYYLTKKGDVIYTTQEIVARFASLPTVSLMEDDTELSKLALALVATPSTVLSQISEIRDMSDPFFDDQIMLLTNDRKIIYVRIFTMAERLKYYNNVLNIYPDACEYNFALAKNGIVKDCQ